MKHLLYAFRNGTESRNLLPLWQRDRGTMPSRRPTERVQRKRALRNGTESRNLLPLWRRGKGEMPSRRPTERVQRKRALRNGTESRNLLPLWRRGRGTMPSRRPVERVQRKMALRNGTGSRNLLPLWQRGRRRGRQPTRKQPPGYLRSFDARRMVSTAPSMPTRSRPVLTRSTFRAASSPEILNREATRTAAESGPEVTKTRRT